MPRSEELYGQHLITPFRRFILGTTTPYFVVPRNTLTGQYSLHPFGIYYSNSELIPHPFKASGYVVNLGDVRRGFNIPRLAYKDSIGEGEVEMFFRIYVDDVLGIENRGNLSPEDAAHQRFMAYRNKQLARNIRVRDRVINLITRFREVNGETEAVEFLREKLELLIRARANQLDYDQAAVYLNPLVSLDIPKINDGYYIKTNPPDVLSEQDFGSKSIEEQRAYTRHHGSREDLYLEITSVAVNPRLNQEGEAARNRLFLTLQSALGERVQLEQRGEGLKKLAEGEKELSRQRIQALTEAGLSPEQIAQVEKMRALGNDDDVIFAEIRPSR